MGCLLACLLQLAADAQNPIIPDLIADPSIEKIGDTYYCYATTDGYGSGLAKSGPPVVWESSDFMHWSFKGIFFPSANGQIYWAPSKAVFVKGKYYLYPTLNHSIYAAVADAPGGPFRLANGADTVEGPAAPPPLVFSKGPKGSKGIDAEVLVDDDGQAYLYWAQHGAARLHKDMVSLDTAVTILKTKREGYSEGPIVFKRKGVYYYLYTLEGHENYKYAYGYSRVGPLGPFTFPEEDIIAATDSVKGIYGPGHGSVFNKPGTDHYYFAYLEFGNGSTNRQVWVDQLQFNADGTIRPVVLTHTGVGALSEFKPETNLALAAKATASSVLPDHVVKPVKYPALHRIESYAPGNALDGSNGSRWMADTSSDRSAWYMIDLGSVMPVKRTEAFFVMPTAGHAYRLEYSSDGQRWSVGGGHTDIRVQSPHVDLLSVKARYLRVTVVGGVAGLWELKVY